MVRFVNGVKKDERECRGGGKAGQITIYIFFHPIHTPAKVAAVGHSSAGVDDDDQTCTNRIPSRTSRIGTQP